MGGEKAWTPWGPRAPLRVCHTMGVGWSVPGRVLSLPCPEWTHARMGPIQCVPGCEIPHTRPDGTYAMPAQMGFMPTVPRRNWCNVNPDGTYAMHAQKEPMKYMPGWYRCNDCPVESNDGAYAMHAQKKPMQNMPGQDYEAIDAMPRWDWYNACPDTIYGVCAQMGRKQRVPVSPVGYVLSLFAQKTELNCKLEMRLGCCC